VKAKVNVSDEASANVDKIHAWWFEHRTAAPFLFLDELSRAIDQLEAAPDSGTLRKRRGFPGLRVVQLKETRCQVYYVHDSAKHVIDIIAVASAVRRRGPKLKKA
jgi:plasmid stabilization system protein ParE